MELSCPSADDVDAIQEVANSAVESFKRSPEMDRARDKEWGKGIHDYRDVVYTRHYDLDLSPMVIYFTAFFNMGDPVDPPPAIVQASLPPEKKNQSVRTRKPFPAPCSSI